MLLSLIATVAPAFAGPPPRPLDPAAWQQLLRRSDAARVVLFTTRDCEYCAAEFARLREELRADPRVVAWFAVVALDGRDSAAALSAADLFNGSDALYYVAGDEPMMRYRVSPRWRGETPYVVLLRADGARRDVLGAAQAGAARWLLETRRSHDGAAADRKVTRLAPMR